jgi:hypothetical protein
MFGNWTVNIAMGSMPQKVASAVAKLNETLLGAEYEPIAYLGSQVVNGVNHAVLAEQTVITGRDTKNVVVLIFNEKPNEMEATLVNIERVVEGGAPLGGTAVNVKTDIPTDAADAFAACFEGYVGARVEPLALLATQVTKGTNYVFFAKMTPVVLNPEDTAMLVTVNDMTHEVSFVDVLASKHEVALGYSFTWLKNGLGKPLGEWP